MITRKISPLDKNQSIGSVSENEGNSNKYIMVYRKLLLLNEKNNLAQALKNIQELLSFSENIFSSSAIAETFLYFCLHGAATGWIIQSELNMPEATVYRALKRLRALGIISPAIKVSKVKNSKGGPRPTVWALPNASTDEVANALKLHFRTMSPKFKVAEEVAQTILDEYASKGKVTEITYKELMIYIKEMRIPFKAPDIAELAAEYLFENGMKVWK